MSVRRSRRSRPVETDWLAARRDRGTVLVLVLVLIVVGALIVVPVTVYTATVLRASKIEQEKTRNVESAKGAVRLALRQPDLLFGDKDRANAGCPDDDSLLLPTGGVANGVSVAVTCVPVDELSADTVFGFDVPAGAAQLQIAPDPAGFSGFTGVLATSGEAPPYPTDGDGPAWAWWPKFSWVNPAEPSDVKTIWLPDLPTLPDVDRDPAPYPMPGTFDCAVFLPGRYDQPVNIDDGGATTNFYFASGVYYFEQPVTISGNVNVIAGQGLADFGVVSDCADDIQVGVNVIVPPGTVYAIDGASGGATWVLGDDARVTISDGGGSPSVQFNQRYAPPDRGGWVNLMSVNGDWSHDNGDTTDDDEFEDVDGDHTATNVSWVPRSQVLRADGESIVTLQLGEPGAEYIPSHPDLTDEARVPSPPADLAGEARRVGASGAITVTFDGVEGAATNGAIVSEYEAGVQSGGATPPTPAPTSVCSTAGATPSLVPAAEGADGADPWGDPHPENAADPDSYSCVISGLTPGSTYWVTARARNDAGWSDWAAPVIVPATDWGAAPLLAPSSEPTNVVVEASSTAADAALVSWDAPTTINGSPILGYDVEVSRVSLETYVGTTTTSTSTTSTTSTTTTTTSTTSTTSTTTTTTLPPPTADCGPPLDCASIPSCPTGEPVAAYNGSSWDWSCVSSCPAGETLTFYAGVRACAPLVCPTGSAPRYRGFTGWDCRTIATNPITRIRYRRFHPDSSIRRYNCPAGLPRFGFGTAFCSTGSSGFRSPLSSTTSSPLPLSVPVTGTTVAPAASSAEAFSPIVAPQGAPTTTTTLPTTTTTLPATTTTLPTYVFEHEELLPGLGCSSVPHMGKTVDDAGLEWTPPPTECVVESLAPLPAVDSDGFDNVGYRIRVYARTAAGRSSEAVHSTPFMTVAGTPVDSAPLPPERVWFPYSPLPILSIDASGGGSTVIDLPGYVSLPMGTVAVANPNGDNVTINGGLTAGRIQINDSRSPLPYGYAPSVIMQRTIDLVATVGNITSVARVKINSDTSYGVVRWVTQ